MKTPQQERAEVETRAVLALLAKCPGKWHTWDSDGTIMPSVDPAFDKGTPRKRILARMHRLVERGLVSGCACGCRGDFEITDKGNAYLLALAPVA